MNLWSLLLPFKWLVIGVGVVFSGIFILLKKTVFLIGSLLLYLFEGIIAISRGIISIIKKTFEILFMCIKWVVLKTGLILVLLFQGLEKLFKGLFRLIKIIAISIYKTLKFIVISIYKALKFIAISIYKALKFIAVYTYLGIFTALKYSAIGFRYLIVYIAKAVELIFKYLYLIIKYFIIYLVTALRFIFTNLYLGFKAFLIYCYKVVALILRYIYIVIKTLLLYIYKALKFMFIDVIIKYIALILISIYKGFLAFLRFLAKTPAAIAKAFVFIGKGLYKIFIKPLVILFTKLAHAIGVTLGKIGAGIKEVATDIANLPKNISKAVVTWFNNLSFIKDIRNRREMKRQVLLIDFDAEDSARSEKKITYRYVAKNADGKIEKGHLDAYSKLDVHSYLLAEGYEVYEIEAMKGIKFSGGRTHKLKTSDMVFFLTQLSTYIKSGIPLVDSIKILSKQTRRSGVKALYKGIIYDLTMGDSFSEAMEKQGESFPKLLVNMVKSSELAGNLSETLDDMADYYSSVAKTRKQMKSAMTYPAVIFVFSMSVVVFILTFVIPQFIQMYKDADAQVPAITTIIINLSDFLINNAIWLVIGLVALVFGFYFMYKNVKVFKLLVQWVLMHTPVIGTIIIYNEVTMFAKTFASLWNHNVFITSSMEILSKITNNEIYKMLIFDAITNVARGEPVSASFKNHWAFPIVAYEMLVTGERTGQPGAMMERVADFYQEEHKNAVSQIEAFIQPVMIIFLAFVVGVILLSVVMPMFGIYSQLGMK